MPPKSNGPNQATAELPPRNLKTANECPPDESEPGVDLSCLNVEKETASKLIAGMHAMTVDETATHLQHEINMPSAKTDLQEIFKSDNVCVVNKPKNIQLPLITPGFCEASAVRWDSPISGPPSSEP